VDVKLFAEDGELYVLAKSEGRHAKERAMRRRKLVRLLKTLRKLRRSAPARDQLLLRIGAARRKPDGPSASLPLRLPREGRKSPASHSPFTWTKRSCRKRSCATATICCARTLLGRSRKCSGNATSS